MKTAILTRENYWAPRQAIAVAKVAVLKAAHVMVTADLKVARAMEIAGLRVVPATVTAGLRVVPATELVKAAPVKAGVRLLAATSANSSSSSLTRTATARLASMKPPNA